LRKNGEHLFLLDSLGKEIEMGIIVVLFLSDTISLNIFFFILFLLFFGQTSKMTGLAFGNDFGDENDCGAVGCRLFLNL
jgi:hypothetical protein